jgi:hypothetical protein
VAPPTQQPLKDIAMNRILSVTALGLALVGAGFTTTAEAASARVVHPNSVGGTTTAGVTARQGANGGTAVRAGRTSTVADGSAQHASGIRAQSAKGSVQSSGTASRDAAGNVTQARSSTVTSAATGNTLKTNSSYSKDTGVTRSASCYNASGASIACPTRP